MKKQIIYVSALIIGIGCCVIAMQQQQPDITDAELEQVFEKEAEEQEKQGGLLNYFSNIASNITQNLFGKKETPEQKPEPVQKDAGPYVDTLAQALQSIAQS